MAEDWRSIDGLQRELSDLKRQVASLAGTVAAIGNGIPVGDAMRAAGRQAAYLGDEAQRAARRHPFATSALAMAALGAIACLVMYNSQERDDRWWHRH